MLRQRGMSGSDQGAFACAIKPPLLATGAWGWARDEGLHRPLQRTFVRFDARIRDKNLAVHLGARMDAQRSVCPTSAPATIRSFEHEPPHRTSSSPGFRRALPVSRCLWRRRRWRLLDMRAPGYDTECPGIDHNATECRGLAFDRKSGTGDGPRESRGAGGARSAR